jgi:hypothetical protein
MKLSRRSAQRSRRLPPHSWRRPARSTRPWRPSPKASRAAPRPGEQLQLVDDQLVEAGATADARRAEAADQYPRTSSGNFSASRIFAAVYPEAVNIAVLLASPAWRALAAGDDDQLSRFTREIGHRIGDPN